MWNLPGIKLLDHILKLLQKILDIYLIEITISRMQFGFVKGAGNTDATFILQKLQEKYFEKNNNLYFAFIDLEKAYDRVPRTMMDWTLGRKDVPERLVQVVMGTYKGSRTQVRKNVEIAKYCDIKVGSQQGNVGLC